MPPTKQAFRNKTARKGGMDSDAVVVVVDTIGFMMRMTKRRTKNGQGKKGGKRGVKTKSGHS